MFEFFTRQFGFSILLMAVVLGIFLIAMAYCILLERKVAAWVQDRLGPNRAGPGGLLPFAPARTTTATPNTIMATIGMITRVPTPRKRSAERNSERNSANQLRRTGSGRNERSSRAHSAPVRGFPGAERASNSKPGTGPLAPLGPLGPLGPLAPLGPWPGPSRPSPSFRGQARSSQGRTGTGWLTVGV